MARDDEARDSDCNDSLLDRRGYLKLAGTAAATVAGVGTATAASSDSDFLVSENFEQSGYAKTLTSNWKQGTYDDRVTSPTKKGSHALRVRLPEGNHYGLGAKYDPVEAGDVNSELTELYASYWIRFSPNFDAGGPGGKIPGPANVEPGGGKGGTPANGTNGWSARGKFEPAGGDGVRIGYYVYHMDMDRQYGSNFIATTVPRGKWVKVEQYIRLNTVSGGNANRDGQLKMWVDDSLEVDKSGMRFTEDLSLGCNYWYDVYYGGGNPSPKDQSVYFDSWKINNGQRPSQSSGDTTTSKTDDQQQQQTQGKVLEVISSDGMSWTDYQFTVQGSVSKRSSAGSMSTEDNDSVTDNGDGTVTVNGVSGDGYGDSFHINGTIVSANFDHSGWTLKYDGTEVSTEDIVFPNTLVIDGSESPNRNSTYQFSVSGSATKSSELGSINAHDTASNGKITGRVIGGTDAYRFSGDITGFSLDGPADVNVDDGS